ncbi:MAG TPA: glycoside hydrolase family 5 protein [Methylomirabilota bacterium]|nr:glycoside hydrolase family 5 protein [Methylomirabilota bacterium]
MRLIVFLSLLCASVTLPGWAQVKVASQARFDLSADTAAGALTQGEFIEGDGSLDRMNWRPAAEQPRTYTANFGITRFSWTTVALRFVPERTGFVTLSLMGPWEEATPGSGTIYRQEILWDAFSAEGTSLTNPGFEAGTATSATGWSGGTPQTAYVWATPLEGSRMLRTWHNGASTRTLRVTAGTPVTLRVSARSYLPPDYQDMKPLGKNTPAHETARRFMRGANLGNYLEAPPNTWGTIVYTKEDFRLMKQEGFDHVRLPIAWHYYAGAAPEHKLSTNIFQKVDFLVTNALAAGLSAMINIHHFDDFTSNPAANTNKFYAIWRQIAARYASFPKEVVFELLNEPMAAATTPVLNPIYAETIRQIRETNPNRTIFLGPSQWNSINELPNLKLPETENNVIVTVHSYEPFNFTHQGATWTSPEVAKLRGIVFPGPPSTPLTPPSGISAGLSNWIASYNTLPTERNPSSAAAFHSRLKMAQEWSEYYGRPVHVGEFGAYELADPQSRANFYGAMREVMDEFGLGWAIWDWKAGFHYIKNGQPDPIQLREALFPKGKLRTSARGKIEMNSAIGKTHVIHRSFALGNPAGWRPVSTQTLSSPQLIFEDAEVSESGKAFYRSEWIK